MFQCEQFQSSRRALLAAAALCLSLAPAAALAQSLTAPNLPPPEDWDCITLPDEPSAPRRWKG